MRFLLAFAVVFIAVSCVHATPNFYKKFQDLYGGPKAPGDFKKELTETRKCSVCHMPGEEKKGKKSSYGEALQKSGLSKNLDKDAKANDAKAVKAIDDAFKKVDEMKSPDGPSYGDLFRRGKFPAK